MSNFKNITTTQEVSVEIAEMSITSNPNADQISSQSPNVLTFSSTSSSASSNSSSYSSSMEDINISIPETNNNCDTKPMRHGCEDSWTWSKQHRSQEVILSGQNSRIAYFHPNWSKGTAGVRGTRILNNGRFYWEVHVSHRIFGTR